MSSTGATSVELAPTPQNREDAAGPKKALSLGEALKGTHNSLGVIRLILASAVIFDHAFPLGGFGHEPLSGLTHGQVTIGGLAVAGFFAISGYLITKSGMSGDVVQFLWRRTLRIFPAYWLVLLITAFLVAPLIWLGDGNSLGRFFTGGVNGPFHYLASNWTLNIGTYGIYDLLTSTTPYGHLIGASAFNGSIWTLIYEWNCYLIIGVLVAFGVMKYARIAVPLLASFFFVLQVVAAVDLAAVATIFPKLADIHMITLGLTFMIGAVLAVYSKSVPFDDRLGILAGLVLILSLRFGGFSTVGTAAGAYFVMYLGARLPKRVQWIGSKNDYSYGIYIYGFLVQQIMAYLGWQTLGYVPFVALALVFSFGFAWISWHLAEKRAMALKGWGPGRGIGYWYNRSAARFSRKSLGTS